MRTSIGSSASRLAASWLGASPAVAESLQEEGRIESVMRKLLSPLESSKGLPVDRVNVDPLPSPTTIPESRGPTRMPEPRPSKDGRSEPSSKERSQRRRREREKRKQFLLEQRRRRWIAEGLGTPDEGLLAKAVAAELAKGCDSTPKPKPTAQDWSRGSCSAR